ncbi:hypothetical protein LINPERPRIM_LOCUS5954 [Linum perenne]
MGKHMKS